MLAPPPPPSEPYHDDAGHVIGSLTAGYISLALSPAGRTALGASSRTARLLDAATAQPLGPSMLGFSAIHASVLSADGTSIAISDGNRPTITTWNAVTGKSLGPSIVYAGRDEGPAWYEGWMAISPDGKMLLVGDNHRKARRWDVASGKEIGTPFPWGKFSDLAFSPDGRIIAAGDKSSLRLWESVTGKALPVAPITDHFLAFSPDSRTLLTTGAAAPPGCGTLRRPRNWVASSPRRDRPSMLHWAVRPSARTASASPPARATASFGSGTSPRASLWGRRSCVATASAPSPLPRMVERSGRPSGTNIRVWDLAGAAEAATTQATWKTDWWPIDIVYRPLAFHPDGESLLMAGGQNEDLTRFREVRTGTPRGPRLDRVDGGEVVSVDVSPDGKTALTGWWTHGGPGKPFNIGDMHFGGGSAVGAVFAWDAANPTKPRRLAEVPEEIMYAVFVKSGQAVAVVSAADANARTMLRLFDATSGQALGDPLPVGPARTEPVAVSPDGRWVVTGTTRAQPGQTAQMWDVTTRQRLGTPLAKAGGVSQIAFSADGRLFATGGGTVVRLWETAGAVPVGDPMVHKGGVTGLTFAKDGKDPGEQQRPSGRQRRGVPVGHPHGPAHSRAAAFSARRGPDRRAARIARPS